MKEYTCDDKLQNKELIIQVGETASENWELLKNSGHRDIWLHLDNHPSPHVFIRICSKSGVDKSTIRYAAELCKSHSKLKNIYDKTVVMYASVRHVKKGDNIGSVIVKKSNKISVR